jgi:hypothetical protein
MVAKLRLLAALGALVTALVVVWQSAPPANVGTPKVQLRSPPHRWIRPRR